MNRRGAVRWVLGACVAIGAVAAPLKSAEAQARLPACVDRADAPPLLDRYDALTLAGGRYRVRLRWDGRAWLPEPALRMPMHHASSIRYVGFTFPDAHADVELEVEAIERALVRHDESHHTFFFEYRVRVLGACTSARP